MLILFETAAGFALFKLLDEGKLESVEKLYDYFTDIDKAKKIVTLKDFRKFSDTSEALSSTTALIEGKLDSTLDSFLRKSIVEQDIEETLAVSDKRLCSAIKEKFPNIECAYNSTVLELYRCIRFQLNDLLSEDGLSVDMNNMSLGLAHSLGRYKLKFSPDKVDVMIVQSISLLDDLDKEINTYSMRVKEWYGWHFPELTRIISDNLTYAKVVRLMGTRTTCEHADLKSILDETTINIIHKAAKLSMGTEISDEDIEYIQQLSTQVIEICEYREELNEYIRNRMQAIAPNLTILVGELVGARLIAHAGSLLNLAKHPSSTIQILGAEKALFRALKTKKPTPKYGLIYHASLVGQSAAKNKGKISRVLANKAALSCRVDALGDENTKPIGQESFIKLNARVQHLEGRKILPAVPTKLEKYTKPSIPGPAYIEDAEVQLDVEIKEKKRKRSKEEGDEEEEEDYPPEGEETKKPKEKKRKK